MTKIESKAIGFIKKYILYSCSVQLQFWLFLSEFAEWIFKAMILTAF